MSLETANLTHKQQQDPMIVRDSIKTIQHGENMSWIQKFSIFLNGQTDEVLAVKRTREAGKYHKREFRCKLGYKILSSTLFILLIAIVIISSSIVLGIEANLRAQFIEVELFFTIFFLVEVIIRILSLKCRYFWSSIWNILDLGLVIMSFLPSIIQNSNSTRQFGSARLFRLIKVGRIFPSLRAVLVGLQNSLMPLFWVFFMMILLMYAFAVFVTTVIGHDYQRWKGIDFESAGIMGENITEEDIKDWFGNIGISMFTLFQITTGESWGLIVRSITALKPFMSPVFIIWIGLTNVCFMNIITGIVVDSTIKAINLSRRIEKENTQIRPMLMKHLRAMEKDGGEEITLAEIEHALEGREFRECFQELGIHPDYIPQLFPSFDKNQGGTVDFDEFCHGFITLDNKVQRKDISLLRGMVLRELQKLRNLARSWATGEEIGQPIESKQFGNEDGSWLLKSFDASNHFTDKMKAELMLLDKTRFTTSDCLVPKSRMSNHTNFILNPNHPIRDKVQVMTEIMSTDWQPSIFDEDLSDQFRRVDSSFPLSRIVDQIQTGIVSTPHIFYIKSFQRGTYVRMIVKKLKDDKKVSKNRRQSIHRRNNNLLVPTNRKLIYEDTNLQKKVSDIGIVFKEKITLWMKKVDKRLTQLEEESDVLIETLSTTFDNIESNQMTFEKRLKHQIHELVSLTEFLYKHQPNKQDTVKKSNQSHNLLGAYSSNTSQPDDAPPAYSEHINDESCTDFQTKVRLPKSKCALPSKNNSTNNFVNSSSSPNNLESNNYINQMGVLDEIPDSNSEHKLPWASIERIDSMKGICSMEGNNSMEGMIPLERMDSIKKVPFSYQQDADLSLNMSETSRSSSNIELLLSVNDDNKTEEHSLLPICEEEEHSICHSSLRSWNDHVT